METRTIEISEQSQIGDARRQIVNCARDAGFNVPTQDRLALLCTELGTNLIKHTPHGGSLLVQRVTDNGAVGIEIFSIDSGKGMITKECLVDGFSSSGTLGHGLGAVNRLADEFHVHSTRDVGTVVQTRIWTEKSKHKSDFSFGGINVPKKGELLSGDKFAIIEAEDHVYCLLVDGLGHGIEAERAAALAVQKFKENLSSGPAAIIKRLHSALTGTRGAVGAVARVDRKSKLLHYCGLGNIEAVIVNDSATRHLVSMNGTLGYEARKVNEFELPWLPGSILIMHSDGLSSRATNDVAAIGEEAAPLIAGWLYKKHGKNHDDATVLVLKQARRECA